MSEDLRADVTRTEVVHTAGMPWSPSPAAGVERKRLERMGPAEAGRVTSVVRYAPGSRFHAHPHPDGEEILVLEGVFSDERGDHPAGTYLVNPEGYSHAPYSEPGCVLFVKLRQAPGVSRTSVRVKLEGTWLPMVDGVEHRVLYADAKYPERVHALRMVPGSATPEGDVRGGEELFVIDGSCRVAGEDLQVGSWMRLPPGSRRRWSTETGCTLYVKQDHLLGR